METAILYRSRQLDDKGKKAMMPVEFIAQQEVVIKGETNFWKLKRREEKSKDTS